MSDRRLVCVSGLPGPGRKQEAEKISRLSKNSVVISAENYHGTGFDVEKQPLYHKSCWEECIRAAKEGVELIVIDNTNLEAWERLPYRIIGKVYDYSCIHAAFGGVGRGLGFSKLRNMEDRQRADQLKGSHFLELDCICSESLEFCGGLVNRFRGRDLGLSLVLTELYKAGLQPLAVCVSQRSGTPNARVGLRTLEDFENGLRVLCEYYLDILGVLKDAYGTNCLQKD